MSQNTAETRRETAPETQLMPPGLVVKVASRFQALSDPNRLRLLQLLLDRDWAVTELADAAELSVANTSKHLALLRSAGFIDRTKQGTSVIYTLANDTPRQLCDLICKDVLAQVEHDLALATSLDAD
ncbi:MAG: metalloregulator ArsR/SmtB family transcription factor [Myxococcota bacterium]